MKKKITIILGVIFLCVVIVGTSVLAFANSTQETVYEIHENKVICSLKTYDETATGKVVIPENNDGIMVTGINEKAFLECNDVTEVVVPKTVVNIGEFSLGYILNENGEKVKKENFVIWGRGNSEAQKYAEANGFTFRVNLTTPELVMAKNAVGGVTVKWNWTENSAGYNVYRKTKKSNWKRIAYVTGEKAKSYLDKTVKNGKDYIYTVRAVYGDELSGYDKTGVNVHHLSAPVVTLKNIENGVRVSWTKNSKATIYRVYKKLKTENKWKRIKTVKSNILSYTDTNVKNNQKAYYCVVAVDDINKSAYETNRYNIFLKSVNVTAAKNSQKGIKVFWDKVGGAEKYRLYRKENGSSWNKIADVKNKYLSYTDKDVKIGSEYDYTVRAISGKSGGICTKVASSYRVDYPRLKNVTASSGGLTVSWNKVSVAERYSVYRRVNNSNWQRIATTQNNNTLTFTDKNVLSGVDYNYTVVAWYKNSKSSFDSEGVTGTYFSSPKLTSARCFKSEKIVVEWNSVGGAQTYTIYRNENGGKYTAIKTVNANTYSFADKDIKVGKEYSYIIRATSYYGIVSGNSNVKSARVLDLNKPMVALTFDDGPSNSPTTRILNTLEKYNSRATFFVVGSRVGSYQSQVKRAYSLNCEIGNHTYNHKTLTSLSASGVLSELSQTSSKIESVIGERPVIMRPPGGSFNNSTVKNNVGAPIIMWSVDTRDWESRNASKIVSNIKNNVRDGSIVLMHDLYDSTASATETIVPWLINNGYQLVTVTELMDAKGVSMQNGSAYYSAR
ncbi:MAG: hypothetical protein E7556_08200 [Ruminococcaceae bacterium]|nr:hypothetical protein [Oscillospiraceae bacterium]